MATRANATITIGQWEERPFSEVAGAGQLARASVTEVYTGDIAGDATTEYLLAYRDEQHASYVALSRVVGRIGGREGSFALEQRGVFAQGVATSTWAVVPESGTGDLRGLRGEGGYTWDSQGGQSTTVTLDYDLD